MGQHELMFVKGDRQAVDDHIDVDAAEDVTCSLDGIIKLSTFVSYAGLNGNDSM